MTSYEMIEEMPQTNRLFTRGFIRSLFLGTAAGLALYAVLPLVSESKSKDTITDMYRAYKKGLTSFACVNQTTLEITNYVTPEQIPTRAAFEQIAGDKHCEEKKSHKWSDVLHFKMN